MIWTSKYFFGNKISAYGLENGRVDYGTLAKSFDAVLNNEIINVFPEYWEKENGWIDNGDEIDEIRGEIEALEEKRDEIQEKIDCDCDCDKCTCENCTNQCGVDKYTKEIEDLENEIQEKEEEIERLEEEQYNEQEIFQWYIVSDCGASILKDYTNEILYYNEKLDMYLWGIDHYGTAWDYVLTDIRIKLDDNENDD